MGTKKIDDDLLLSLLREGKQQQEVARIMGVTPAAICQRLRKLLPEPESLKHLTEREKRFVLAKVQNKTNTDAALLSYEAGSRESAKVIGSQLMDKPEVRRAIDDLMELRGIGREFRVSKLGEHMKNRDPGTSLRALELGFKLADDFPVQKRFNVNVDVDLSPVDLSRYRAAPMQAGEVIDREEGQDVN